MANALAVSVNARGGPGLVVAWTAFAAGIIDSRAYTSLVVLAVLTSVGAGVFLAQLLRRDPAAAELLRVSELPDPAALQPATPASVPVSRASGRVRTSSGGAA